MTLSRKSTWANADGLQVGFGNHYSEREATAVKQGADGYTELVMDFTFASTTLALAVPAGFIVDTMVLEVGTAWTSSGTATIEIGDGGDANGWFTTTELTEANLTAGTVHVPAGAYAVGDNSDNRGNPFKYATADTIDVVFSTAGDAPSAGSARLVVRGFVESVAAV